MLRYFRYAILGIFVVSAALTPPDMVSIFLLAIPLLLLYGLSVGVSYMFRAQTQAEANRQPNLPPRSERPAAHLWKGKRPMAIIEEFPRAPGAPGIRAALDPQRQGCRRHRLLDREPHLVHRLGRRAQRDLLSDDRSAPDPRPAVPGDRRRNLFPRRPSQPGYLHRVPRRSRPGRAHNQRRPCRALPRRDGGHHRPASAVRAARYPGGGRRRRCCAVCVCSCCSRRISKSADGATTATWRGWPGANF